MIGISKNKLFAWTILISLVIVWGSSFILIKKGLDYYSPLQLGTLRMSIAFLCLAPLAFTRLKGIDKQSLFFLFISGFIGSAIPAVFFSLAEVGLDSSTAGVLNSLTTVFTLLVGISFFSYKTGWINALGVFIGLAGAIGLLSISGGNAFNFNLKYGIWVILATIMYAFNGNIIKHKLKEIDPVTITVLAFTFAGVPSILILLLGTDFIHLMSHDKVAWQGLIYVALLAVFGTAIAMIFFNKLIKKTTAVFASSVTYLMPVVAILWGAIDGEKFDYSYFIWIILILAGVIMVGYRKYNAESSL